MSGKPGQYFQLPVSTKIEDRHVNKMSSDLRLVINFSSPVEDESLAVRDSDEGRFWGQITKT